MKRSLFQRSLGAVWILLALWAWGASPSYADDDFKKLASEIAARIHAMKRSRVTVVEFGDLDMKSSKLGKFLAQRLQATLAEPVYDLVVVDQSHTPQLFDQARKLAEGLIDQATGQQIGRMYGTEVLIVGTVMPSSVTVRVDIRAVDLQTAKMITGGTAKVAKFGIIEKLAMEDSGEGQAAADEDEAPTAVNSKPKPKAPARVRHDLGMTFELDGCSLSGGSLTCDVTVTSQGRDRWLTLAVGSQAWNGGGEEFKATEVSIANSRSDRSCAMKQVLKGVPTRLSLIFPNFESDEDAVERLRVSWLEDDNCRYYGAYRGVDFEKIALSDDIGSSSSRSRSGGDAGKSSKGKRGGGFLNQMRGLLEDTATKLIEKEVDKLTGEDKEDEEEDKDPPQH